MKRIVKSFDLYECSLMPDGTFDLGLTNVKYKEMLQLNDLRIGNWVRGKNKYKQTEEFIKVESIHYKGINVYSDTEYGHPVIEADYSFEDLQPIPLTEELLEKCGFKMTSNYSPEGEIYSLKHRDGISFEVCIAYKGVDIIQNIGRIRMLNIKYLHQLQNLYFILTDEELKIDL